MAIILGSKPGGAGGGGAPSGAAGGDLSGSYPNPTIAAGAVEDTMLDSGAATVGQVATADGAGGVTYEDAGGGGLYDAYVMLSDVKAQNTDGGTFTSGAWRTRTLNTEDDPSGIVTLAANQFVLAAGTYVCSIACPAAHVKRSKARLFNVTDTAVVLGGRSSYNGTGNADATQVDSEIRGRFTIAASKTLEVQHQCETTSATIGFGVASNFAAEIYTVAEFWREA